MANRHRSEPGARPSVSAAPPPSRSFLRRLFWEAAIITVLAILALLGIFSLQNFGLSLSKADPLPNGFGINVNQEPWQQVIPFFRTTMDFGEDEAVISGDTLYSINAKVESIKAYEDPVAAAIPFDLLLAWGDLAADKVDGKLSWEQANRRGQVAGALGGRDGPDLSAEYVVSHVSNNHLVPANKRLREAISTIKRGDYISIEGKLVDVRMETPGRTVRVATSKSRKDQGEGACEIIYVERLQINNLKY